MLPEAWRLRATLGLSFLTVRPGVLILLGVTFGDGDGFEFGVRGFTGVVLGVAMTDVASWGGERGVVLLVDGPGDRAGDRAGDLAGDFACVKGVDMARVRGVAGTIFEFTCVSDSDVKRETAADRTLRRDAATEGAAGPFRGIGTLFWRDGVVVDLLREEETLDVDILGSRNEEGGTGSEILRELLAVLSLLARLGG